jgi:Zn-dependent protease
LLLLVPILFFHELGHYLAMLLFRYRNVRMFFIPLFGAAVNGQNYTAPGWKKVIVAMAGPLPGIVVGGVLACVGIVLHHALLMKAAMLTLLINGFNLLPVLPLDGGRIVQVLLFSRHYGLDLAFRIVTVVILAGLGFLPGGRIFFYLAIAMAISIPSAIRTGKIAQELRTRGVGPRPGDDQTIPLDVAQQIISRLKSGVTSRLSQQTKTLAQQTLSVYEGICARPPGWASTIGFGVFYIGGILLSLALTLVLVVAQPGRFNDLARAAAAQPKQKLSPADIVMFPNPTPVSTAAHQNIIANFPRPGDAITAFDALRPQLTDGESIERFGQTLMVSLAGISDDERHHWIDRVQARTNEFCVEGAQAPVSIRLTCVAPSNAAAEKIQKELNEYFGLMYVMRVIPPWMPDDARTPQERAAQRVARQTYQRLTEAGSTAYKDPQVRELSKKIRQARQYGDTAKVEQLSKESTALMEHLRQRDIDHIRAANDGSVDQEVVRQYMALPKPNFDDEGDEISTPKTKAQYHAMALRMGEAPEGDDRYLVRYGGVGRREQLLTFSYLSFHDTPQGAPALVNWLADKGCKSMHYEIKIRALEIPDVQSSSDGSDR